MEAGSAGNAPDGIAPHLGHANPNARLVPSTALPRRSSRSPLLRPSSSCVETARPRSRRSLVKSVGFRRRLFVILSLFALVPALLLTLVWGAVTWQVVPFISAGAAWERVAATGEHAIAEARKAPIDDRTREALRIHELELQSSVVQARRLDFLATRAAPVVLTVAILALILLWVAASRVAGHFARQLGRPIHELVGWTAMIQRGERPPATSSTRGAPEFETLRSGMRAMAGELERGRQQAVEAERLRAFRETARRVAHEIKNPLTPMQFAVAQIRRVAPPEAMESLRVLEDETARLDRMARSFSQFGRLPEGPPSEIDLAELLRATAAACVPSHLEVRLDIDEGLPHLTGHHDALQRALMNVLLNAVEACGNSGRIALTAARTATGVRLAVSDSGEGIAPERLPGIFEPYVTSKPGGTGLGLAITEQTIEAHGGQVSASSAPGAGTTITFDLPLPGPFAPGARTPWDRKS